MTTFTIKTANGFDTNNVLPLNQSQIILKNKTNWVVQDNITGDKYVFLGSDFTYNSYGLITSGLVTKVSQYDKTGNIIVTAQFSDVYDVTKQGYPTKYSDLLTGDDSIIGGNGNDTLSGGNGAYSSIPNLFNTGAGLANGDIDYHYKFTALSGSATGTFGYSVAAVGNGGVINSSTWRIDNSISHWLIPSSNRDQSYDAYSNGVYNWSLQFDLTGYDAKTASLSGKVSVDNSVIIKLNGVIIGTAPDFLNYYNFNANNGFVDGVNTLEFIVTNYANYYPYGNPTGLRVEFTNSQVSAVTNDTFKGGLGNDTYIIDSTGDKVVEFKGQGNDTIKSSISNYKLPSNVENLIITDNQSINGLGNELNNSLTGNDGSNLLVGFSGNDTLKGNSGFDTLEGGSNNDTAVYSGLSTEYKIEYQADNSLKIIDNNLSNGDDGTDILIEVEKLKFSDKTIDANKLFSSDDVFNKAGYYHFFAMLSSAVYLHTGVGDEPKPTEHRAFELNNYQKLISTMGFHFLSAKELGIASSGDTKATWYDPAYPMQSLTSFVNYHYDFKNGFYGTDASLSPASAFASVGATKDALFVTFRGTDQTWDWVTDATGMHQQYAMYSALTQAIDNYLVKNPNKMVYVSGHSLGGQMATLYMSEHFNDPRFIGTEFEAANKLLIDNQGNLLPKYNPNIVNIEMPYDPVPDLGINRGDVIQLNMDSSFNITAANHPMSEVFKYIDLIDTQPKNPIADINLNTTIISKTDPINITIENQKASYFTGSDLKGSSTIVIDASDDETYQFDSDIVYNKPTINNIIIKDDDITFSEDVNYSIKSTETHGKLIVGNSGNNKLTGGSGSDTLVGGADVDLLIGGNGNDILFGGLYKNSGITLSNTTTNLIQQYSDAKSVDEVDVGYYMGGFGADTMIGELSEAAYNSKEIDNTTDNDGDNDYFFIDVNFSNNNTGNVDIIKNFYVAGSDATADDWLVFSAEQLGLSESYMKDTLGWDKGTLDIFGKEVASYNLDLDAGGTFGSEHFFKLNGINTYEPEILKDDEPTGFSIKDSY